MTVSHAGKPMNLVMPLAALGVGGALVVADLLRVGCFPRDDDLAVFLVTSLPLATTLLGLLFSWTQAASRPAGRLASAAVTCATGALLGAAIGSFCWGEQGAAMGASDGLGIGAGFAVAFAVVGAAARRAGRARPSSVVDSSDRLLVAAAVAALLGISAGGVLLRRVAHPTCTAGLTATPVVAAVSTIALLVIVGLQWASLARASAVMARAQRAVDPAFGPDTPCFDYGIGDELGAEYGARRNAYRDRPAVIRVTRGSPTVARRVLVETLAVEAALLVPLVAACLLALA
jgi:hypothetical protein